MKKGNTNKKAIFIAAYIDKLPLKQNQIQKSIMMENEFFECMGLAENFFWLMKNALKGKSDQLKQGIQVLEREIVELEANHKKCCERSPLIFFPLTGLKIGNSDCKIVF